jgi:glucose/arabinose dehydrogenase
VRKLWLVALLGAGLAAPSAAHGAVTLAQIGTFAQPTYVTAPPGDRSRVFVVERPGTVRLLEDGVLTGQPFMDLTALVQSGGEEGLLSIAFAPDYATSGLLYAYYTE